MIGSTRTNGNLHQWHHTWNFTSTFHFRIWTQTLFRKIPKYLNSFLNVLRWLYQTELRSSSLFWVLYFTHIHYSMCHRPSWFVKKKKKKIEFDGMERKQIIEKLQLRGKQIVLLPFVRVSEEIIQTDGKMNDPSAEVTCWLAFFSAISLFANHYPWHTLLFYPSIKMREGRKRAREKERERWMHLVTCSSIS